MRFEDICAVVVTYRYPYAELEVLLEHVAGQVGRLVVVDNNPDPDDAGQGALQSRMPDIQWIVNRANLGLSRALNQGLEAAIEAGARYAILFDQDSRPEPGMLERLVDASRSADASAALVAAWGPVIVDDRLRRPLPFIRFRGGWVLKHYPQPGAPGQVDTDMLITSGCLLDLAALKQIGPMDEAFFIDNIDLEWSFRARAAGFRLIGIPAAVLRHRIGDRVRPLPGTRRNILVHGPLRQYHIMRNRIRLYWRGYVPLLWKVADVPRLIFKLVYFPLMVAPRLENLRMMLKGVRDGIAGR